MPADTPIALTQEFANDSAKQAQWAAFVRKVVPSARAEAFAVTVQRAHDFLEPVRAAILNERPMTARWRRATGWDDKP